MEEIESAKSILLNASNSIQKRMRALFFLRNIKTAESANAIALALTDKSILLKHELCYVLGQMLIQESIEVLKKTLSNKNENEIVRHEAGEALGNFLTEGEFLKNFLNDENVNVRETCYIAFKKYENQAQSGNTVSPFDSIDPANPCDFNDIEKLKNTYINSTCMYDQYRAMFSLRNLNQIEILSLGFQNSSSLFKHEVAFVYGQMRNKESVKYLEKVLENTEEHEMVRHECAEALGAIGSEEAYDVLKRFINDPSDIVRESVEVALDIHAYETGNEAEYAVI